ncbi:1-phosphatidylinositol phosphodiesterase-like isoform X2 [Convolutriloba macropyga]|uniref:1-phosphatidylinositol phosphodiesterase-like isoform X2 n=1 Tax=Convolutriloba macropyga TaxID=536237 RepID=UPI003F51EFD3
MATVSGRFLFSLSKQIQPAMISLVIILLESTKVALGASGVSGSNWMSHISGTWHLSQVTIPGTHNSGAKFNLEKSFLCLPQACACQTMSIERQLQSGVRFLDIRLHHRNDKFRINHAVVDLGLSFDDVIHAVRKFLRSNGREAIVMRYREEGEADDVTRSFEDTLMTYVDKNKDLFYSNMTIPQLDEARGKVVLINGKGTGCEHEELGLCKKNGAWSKKSEENDWEPDCDPKDMNSCQKYVDDLINNMKEANEVTGSNSSDPPFYFTYTSCI